MYKVQKVILIQTFISQFSIKAFHKWILSWLTWINKAQSCWIAIFPFNHGSTCKLCAIVYDNMFWQSSRLSQLVQNPSHSMSRQRRINFNTQTFTIEIVYDIQHPELPGAIKAIVNKIHTPALVRTRWYRHGQPFPEATLLLSFPGQGKAFLAVYSFNPLVVNRSKLSAKQNRESRGSISLLQKCNFLHSYSNPLI
jgi:hypothetical protein